MSRFALLLAVVLLLGGCVASPEETMPDATFPPTKLFVLNGETVSPSDNLYISRWIDNEYEVVCYTLATWGSDEALGGISCLPLSQIVGAAP